MALVLAFGLSCSRRAQAAQQEELPSRHRMPTSGRCRLGQCYPQGDEEWLMEELNRKREGGQRLQLEALVYDSATLRLASMTRRRQPANYRFIADSLVVAAVRQR